MALLPRNTFLKCLKPSALKCKHLGDKNIITSAKHLLPWKWETVPFIYFLLIWTSPQSKHKPWTPGDLSWTRFDLQCCQDLILQNKSFGNSIAGVEMSCICLAVFCLQGKSHFAFRQHEIIFLLLNLLRVHFWVERNIIILYRQIHTWDHLYYFKQYFPNMRYKYEKTLKSL